MKHHQPAAGPSVARDALRRSEGCLSAYTVESTLSDPLVTSGNTRLVSGSSLVSSLSRTSFSAEPRDLSSQPPFPDAHLVCIPSPRTVAKGKRELIRTHPGVMASKGSVGRSWFFMFMSQVDAQYL